jgi:phosphoribosylformylglycinamidine synthase
MPIKHGEGAYFAPPEELSRLEAKGQILLRYCDASGRSSDAANPNGSAAHAAAVTNERGNVLGMMPHPEHAVEPRIGGTDGRVILGSLVDVLARSTL